MVKANLHTISMFTYGKKDIGHFYHPSSLWPILPSQTLYKPDGAPTDSQLLASSHQPTCSGISPLTPKSSKQILSPQSCAAVSQKS